MKDKCFSGLKDMGISKVKGKNPRCQIEHEGSKQDNPTLLQAPHVLMRQILPTSLDFNLDPSFQARDLLA